MALYSHSDRLFRLHLMTHATLGSGCSLETVIESHGETQTCKSSQETDASVWYYYTYVVRLLHVLIEVSPP